jgi:hypothetical protein
MSDRDPGEEIIHDLGMDPGLDVDSNQRAELLQRWHEEAAEKEAAEKAEREKKNP